MAGGHFDAGVVGSGFGGAVSAYRLAEAGLRVCVLERGQAYPPGAFPRGAAGLRQNYWDPSRGGYGMFNVWSFTGLEAVVSSGLGGGSLIYANVLLPMDERGFVPHAHGVGAGGGGLFRPGGPGGGGGGVAPRGAAQPRRRSLADHPGRP